MRFNRKAEGFAAWNSTQQSRAYSAKIRPGPMSSVLTEQAIDISEFRRLFDALAPMREAALGWSLPEPLVGPK